MLVACVVVLCATLAPPAEAAPGGDATVQPAFFLAPLGEAGATASCPLGRRITGGGLGASVTAPPSLLRVSGPVDENGQTATTLDGDIAVSWVGNVINGIAGTVHRTFAICSATSDAVVYESTFTVPGLDDGGAFESCPVGSRVVGGGVGTTDPTIAGLIKQSAPLGAGGTVGNTVTGQAGRTWGVLMRNPSAQTRTFRAYVVCSLTSDATIVATSFSVAPGSGGQSAATCPAGRRVLGGGIGTLGNQTRVNLSVPTDQAGAQVGEGGVGRQWLAIVSNNDQVARTFKTFALCATDDLGGPANPPPAPGVPGGPTPPGQPGGGPVGGTPDTTRPVLSGLSLSRSRFRAANSGPSIVVRRGRGTSVRYTVTESGTVRFTVQRATAGRRVEGRCVRPRRSNRRARRCTRYTPLAGSFTHEAQPGPNRFTFSGRLNGRKLRPAAYRLRAVATDGAGNRSDSSVVRFRIRR